jgi:hypothetical protein
MTWEALQQTIVCHIALLDWRIVSVWLQRTCSEFHAEPQSEVKNKLCLEGATWSVTK